MKLLFILALLSFAFADDCPPISNAALTRALRIAVCGGDGSSPCSATGPLGATTNAGFGFNMWATIVSRQGYVCQVAYSGPTNTDQWPGSRVISAQKANTANSFSLNHFALATSNLYTLVQPGSSLFGLQESNPVDTSVAYGGSSANYGRACVRSAAQSDGMCGQKIGGVNVFGGGLGLYTVDGTGHHTVVGGLGVSGDTSCADAIIAWKVRDILCYNNPPNSDQLLFTGAEAGLSQPSCLNLAAEQAARDAAVAVHNPQCH